MPVASVALGIVAYSDARLASDQARLHFAADDARAFHRYVTTAWNEDEGLHLCLTDQEATSDALERAIGQLAAAGPLDLFLLYLSGHGEIRANEGWFCLADAASGEPSLTIAELDRLLATIDAGQVLVIADYCYSEASLSGSRFFAALDGDSARIFVASARSSQKAWEDTDLKRSILSDVLLKALASGSPLSERDGTVDVETKLIPHLREQVPLEAAVRKRGSVQEPVAGGLASGPIRLPTVAARDMRRNLSISDTLRMRLRRILTVGAIAVLAAWLIADLLIYHLAVDSTGAIRVRPGPAALYGLTPYHLGREVDTGFTIQDLSVRDQDAFRRLSRGREFGFTTRKDRDGLARWLTQLQPALTSTSASRARMLARADTPQVQGDEPPPVWEAAFVAYAGATELHRVADRIYPAPAPIEVDCGRPVDSQMDFSLLDVPPDAFARDLVWRALRIDDTRRLDALTRLVAAVAYRGAHAEDAGPIERDTEALAATAALMASGSRPQLPRLPGWCEGAHAALVRALTGDQRARADAEAALVAGLPSGPTPPGENPPPPQMAAIAALTALVSRGALQHQTVAGITLAFDRSGEQLGMDTPLNRLLLKTVAHQPLPPGSRSRLFEIIGGDGDTAGFEAIVAFRLLSRNAQHLTAAERLALRAWLDREGEANRTVSQLHEALGNLAQVMPLKAEEKEWLVERLSPYSWLSPQAVSYRGEMVISASDGEAAVALARINQRQPLSRDVVERLLTIAAHRSELEERPAMLRGLGLTQGRFDRQLIERLLSHKTSSVMRRLYIDIAVEQLGVMPKDERARILANLLQRWQRSRAPEMRLALGEIIGRVVASSGR